MSWRYDSFTLYGTTGAAKTTGKVEVRLAPVARFVTPKNSSLPLKSVAIFAACEVVCSLGDLAAAYPVNKLTSQAYCKMLLHAAKYPHYAVNGLLVAEKPKEKKRESHTEPVLCVDCVPLFHGTLALAPMLEVALTLIDTWCKENKYIIVGYYQANERTKDSRPNQVAEKVAARISENFSEATIVMVDNNRLNISCFEPIVLLYDHHENKWKNREVTLDCFEDWSEAQKITSALLENRSYENLIDFDNHLDDLRNDWTNPVINKSVLDLC